MIERAFGTVASQPFSMPEVPETLELEACYSYCEAVTRARHHNFPVASRFVPSHLRKHIWAVYAFARAADDFADEADFEGRRTLELDRWEQRLENAYRHKNPEHPIFVALKDTTRRFNLPITPFSSLLSGFRQDIDFAPMASYTDLRSYTSLSAQPVGKLYLYLCECGDPALLRYMDELSSGLAEARLWQDMAADLRRDRIYVPLEDLRHFGISVEALGDLSPEEGFADLVRFLTARTRAIFMKARPLVEGVGDELAVEMAISWHGGMRILEKIDRCADELLHKPPVLGHADKALVVSRALRWRGGSLPGRLRL